MIVASFTSTVIPVSSALTAVIAASAAVGAAWLAWQTVQETKGMRQEAREAAKAATLQFEGEMADRRRLAEEEAADRQHLADAEAGDRKRLALAEMFNRQIEQLERISDLLLQITHAARDECRVKPEQLVGVITGSRLPSMLIRLENAAATFHALGGRPLELTAILYTQDRGMGTPPIRVLGDANSALSEIAQLTLMIGSERVAVTGS